MIFLMLSRSIVCQQNGIYGESVKLTATFRRSIWRCAVIINLKKGHMEFSTPNENLHATILNKSLQFLQE